MNNHPQDPSNNPETQPSPDEPLVGGAALEAARREKLRKIQAMGFDPWGGRFDGHLGIGEIRARENEIVVEAASLAAAGIGPAANGP